MTNIYLGENSSVKLSILDFHTSNLIATNNRFKWFANKKVVPSKIKNLSYLVNNANITLPFS